MKTLYERLNKQTKEKLDRIPNSSSIQELKITYSLNTLSYGACEFVMNCADIEPSKKTFQELKNQFTNE